MRPIPEPNFRRLRIYAFDPAASTDLRTAVINEAIAHVTWENGLRPGPVGEYLEVVDFDPASEGFYFPVDLDEKRLLAQDGHAPSEGNPQFHQQMVYAVAMTTIRNFEHALGRKVLWAARYAHDFAATHHEPVHGRKVYVPRLRIYPHALREANAYYSPQKRALLFGYFRASTTNAGRNLPGGIVFACLSHDVIAHETAHAILDGMHRPFIEPSGIDSLAFHEAFADIVALFQHFTMPEAVRHQIAQVRGDLSQRSLLSSLAKQFGEAIGHYGALRDGLDDIDPETGLPDATAITRSVEPHDRGAILVAAVFDAFVTIYHSRVADLIRLVTGDEARYPETDLHPDLVGRLTAEANKVAGHILRMCVRALDYLPPVDVTFGDFLRALITADHDLVPNDRLGYRIAVVEAFRRRGIYPRDCRSLAIDSLLWERPDETIVIDWLNELDLEHEQKRSDLWLQAANNADVLWKWFNQHADGLPKNALTRMGLSLGRDAKKTIRRSRKTHKPGFEIQSVRTTRRIGPDGDDLPQLVVEITQTRRGFSTSAAQQQADETGWAERKADFVFRGGCTLIVDLRTKEVRYVISKNIDSNERLETHRKYLFEGQAESLGATYFGMGSSSEPFAFLHRHG